jgi:sulfate transport system substrate-binding protein
MIQVPESGVITMARYAHSESEETIAEPGGSPMRYRLLALLVGVLLTGLILYQTVPAMIAGYRTPVKLVVYGFSTQADVFGEHIFPDFEASWEAESGRDLIIEGVFGPSGTLANQIVLGAPADVAIFSNAQHVNWLRVGRQIEQDTQAEIIGSTPMAIVVRPGNPLGVEDFSDLAQEGVQLLHAEPGESGAGDWAVLAEYGSAFLEHGDRDAAENLLTAIWENVTALGTSARGTLALFDLGAGDALVTYEQDALLAQDRGVPLEIVLPPRTIIAQHVAVIVDANVTSAERAAAEDFVRYLLSDAGQRTLAEYHLRPPEIGVDIPDAEPGLFTVDDLGGWSPAYHDLIEGLWKTYLAERQETRPLPTLSHGQD